MAVHPISDPEDPRIADYRNLSDGELLAQHGVFVAEGRMVVRRLLTASRFAARSVLVTPPALASLEDALAFVPTLEVFVASQDVMNSIAGFQIHRGCLALGDRLPTRAALDPPSLFELWRASLSSASRLLVLEGVADADNIGSIFRNAAAFGVDGILLDPTSTDPLYRKAIRTSMGATLQLPFARATSWPSPLADLRREGVTLVALTPRAAAPPLSTVARQLRDRRVALVVGHEGNGLGAGALAACDVHARIPMAEGADSINVATAAGIALYELGRGG